MVWFVKNSAEIIWQVAKYSGLNMEANFALFCQMQIKYLTTLKKWILLWKWNDYILYFLT